ncbi:type II secretion system F family protein [Roseomonas elaeocarpi]|uniref:Type II secretion system F family protein n=1 Tax=Roseomonas elaeocarpi TaxID=907779 RepID=A0ABV6JS58_9PROT
MSEAAMLTMLAAGVGALSLAMLAVLLLAREGRRRLLSGRIRAAVTGAPLGWQSERRSAASLATGLLSAVGEALRRRALFSERDLADLERAVAAAGYDPRRVVSTFIGAKVLLLVGAVALAGGVTAWSGSGFQTIALSVAAALVAGVMVPNWVVAFMRRPFQAALRRGLPDALDLLVVCAEAGLGMDTAVERMAREMALSNRAISIEFTALAQELRLLPDRRQALARMGERTGMESFQRLAVTMAQTLQYGTPLSQALRVLSAEMRGERMTRLEERAAKLPALLVLPLILFIMPCLFIVLLGPSILQLVAQFGGGP